MGDQVSIQFKCEDKLSVVLFHHTDGMKFVEMAKSYVEELKKECDEDSGLTPLDRLEPNVVMVDFIRYITSDKKRIWSGLRLGKDETDGDNSDNGHFIISLD